MLKKVKILCYWKRNNAELLVEKNGYKIGPYVAAYKQEGLYRIIDLQTGMMIEDPKNSHARFHLKTLSELEEAAEDIRAWDLKVRSMKGYNRYVEKFELLKSTQ